MTAVELHEDPEELERLRDEWDALAVACARPGSSAPLLIAWWRNLAPASACLRVVSVRRDGRLVGLAPLFLNRGPLGLPALRFLGTPHMPQRHAILAAPGEEREVMRAVGAALAASRPRPVSLGLERIDAAATWPSALAGSWPAPLGAALACEFSVSAPVLTMNGGRFDDWLAGKSSNFRKEVRRTRRKLEASGARVHRVRDAAALERALTAFARLHGAHWGDRSKLWRPPTLGMLREAGETMVPEGRMRVYTVEADGEAIAVELLFAAGGEVASWNTAWDPAWADERPSMGALYQAIEDCFEGGDRRLDLGEGKQPYKLRLADDDEPVSWMTLIPRGAAFPLAQAVAAPRRIHRAVRTLVQRLPPPTRQRIAAARRLLRGGAPRGPSPT